jgi:prophage maintenance system killer protein
MHLRLPGRDVGLLQSALARPQQLHAYDDAPDAIDMAAAYTVGIVRNHLFVDGNKRTAFVVGVLFLELNGHRFTATEERATQAVLPVFYLSDSRDGIRLGFRWRQRIDPRYRPIHVRPNAPDGPSPRAAAMEAAYVISAHGRSVRTRAFLTKQYTAGLEWNRVAAQISIERGLSFHQNVHLFALLNVTMADAVIACWDSKYRYSFWPADHRDPRRPYSDRHRPHVEGPCLDFFKPGTPAFPEYPSAHASISGSVAFILASIFGDNTSFTVISESRPGTRSFSSFSSAVAEIADVRVIGGIHFRTSCVLGNTLGSAVANHLSRHAMRRR